MSYPSNPGGSFSTGPSTSPILSEPTNVVAQGNPVGPAPSTGPLTAYVDAQASTDAQKTNLLSSIATLGSVGKQAYVQQQQQTNQARAAAIQGINATQGMAGTPTGVQQALSAAFAGQQNATTQQQASLENYQGGISNASSNWYDQTKAAIPIMQERTAQQVNSFYAAQRLQAQKDAAAMQQQQLTAKESGIRLQIAQAELQKAQAAINGNLTPTEQIAMLNLGKDKNAQAFQDEILAKVQAMNGIQDPSGVKHGDKFLNLFTGIQTAAQGVLKQNPGAQPQDVINAMITKADSQGALTNVVDRKVLSDWLNAYFNGMSSGWRDIPGISNPGIGGPGYTPPSGGSLLPQAQAPQGTPANVGGLIAGGAIGQGAGVGTGIMPPPGRVNGPHGKGF